MFHQRKNGNMATSENVLHMSTTDHRMCVQYRGFHFILFYFVTFCGILDSPYRAGKKCPLYGNSVCLL
jgi:hypothetical protein